MRVLNAFVIAFFASVALPVWSQAPMPADPPAMSASLGDQKDKDVVKDKDDKSDKGDKNDKDDKKGKGHKKHNHKHKE